MILSKSKSELNILSRKYIYYIICINPHLLSYYSPLFGKFDLMIDSSFYQLILLDVFYNTGNNSLI